MPANHLLRRVDAVLDFGFVRRALAPYYSSTGRPSVDPELMLRMLLIGYLHGIRSERRLCDEVHLNLAYRWFCRLGLDGGVPDHSTFSKNRHGRFPRRRCASAAVRGSRAGLCTKAGLTRRTRHGDRCEHDRGRRRLRAQVHRCGGSADAWDEQECQARPVRDYLAAARRHAAGRSGRARAGGRPNTPRPFDPQAAWSIKHGPGQLQLRHELPDRQRDERQSWTWRPRPRASGAEVAATRTLITRAADRFGFHPERLAADKAYGSAGLLRWLFERGIEPHVPLLDRTALTQGKLPRSAFTYDETADAYTCPEVTNSATAATSVGPARHRYSGSPTPAAPARESRSVPTRPRGAC